MANTISNSTLNEVFRINYAQEMLNLSLKTMTVADAIFTVDRSGAKYIANPYLTAISATAAAIAGTYSVSNATTTGDVLNITEQATASVHLMEFEEKLSRADLFGSLVKELRDQVVVTVDKYALNYACNNAGESYTTIAGGFTTPGNINKIIGDLCGKVAGYASGYSDGLFLVIENTDLTGLIQAGMSSGFSFADAVLNNGFAGKFGGVDVYVVRTGTFVTGSIGTLSATNSGKRLFGVKRVAATLGMGDGAKYDEKKVTAKTGREIVLWCNYGMAVWNPKASLLVKITLA
jgi:hypothetical protein